MALHRTILAALPAALLLAACGGLPKQAPAPGPVPAAPRASPAKADPSLPVLPPAGSGRGGYYQDDGPGENPPAGLREVPDAVVKAEPLAKYSNRPYVVMGKTYTPLVHNEPYSQRGVASWYGKKFHGQRTSSGELYDMYKMTAAHPTLPIPSYARITNLASGEQVVVRINDRGPFHSSRIVDVSYTAALKLGLLGKGSHEVLLERVLPGESLRVATKSERDAPSDVAALMLEDRASEQDAARAEAQAPTEQQKIAPGFYLQLGAYSRQDKAAEMRGRVLASGAVQTVDVVKAGAVHRLFGGPFATRAEALKAARTLPSALAIKPIVVRREGDD
jgi:rare lipoprotein A